MSITVGGTTATSGQITQIKTDLGLGNVNNTADADKPVSTAQAAAISAAVAGKADASAVATALAAKADASALAAKADTATVTAALATKAAAINASPVVPTATTTLTRAAVATVGAEAPTGFYNRPLLIDSNKAVDLTGAVAGDAVMVFNNTASAKTVTAGGLTLTIPAYTWGEMTHNGAAFVDTTGAAGSSYTNEQAQDAVAAAFAAGTQTGVSVAYDDAAHSLSIKAGVPATITGTPGVGNLLTATLPAGVSAALKNWTRNGADISGATGLTYTQVTADASTTVGFWYTPAISGAGVSVPAISVTVPGAPTAVTFGTATSTTQPLTWTAPASNGGAALTGYRVGYRIAGSGGAYTYLATGSTTTGYVVTGLTASTSYQYVVQAVNSVGNSADSSAVTGSTAAAVQPLRFASRTSRQATSSNAAPAGRLVNVSRQPIWIGSGDRSDLVLSFANWWTTTTAVVLGTNDFTVVDAWLEKGDGTAKTQLKFGGANSTTVAAGATDIKTDAVLPSALGLTKFSRDEKYWLRITVSVTTAGHVIPSMDTYINAGYPASVCYWCDPTENPTMAGIASAGLGNFAISGSITNSNALYVPTVLGRFVTGDAATYLAVGDSITDESSDTTSGVMARGYFQRALASNAAGTTDVIAAMKIAQGGSTAALWAHANAGVMEAYLKYAKYLWDAYGTNYFALGDTTGATNTTAKAGVQAIWTKATAQGVVGVVRTNLTPRIADGDFTTTGTQAYLNTAWGVGGDARAFNTWVDAQSGVSPVVAIVPFASARDSTDPWKWPVTGAADYATADGVHPSTAIHTLMAADARTTLTSLA
jgi:hypothetical protein